MTCVAGVVCWGACYGLETSRAECTESASPRGACVSASLGPSDLLGCVTRGTYLERLATEQLFIVRAAGVGSRSPYVTRSLSAQVC